MDGMKGGWRAGWRSAATARSQDLAYRTAVTRELRVGGEKGDSFDECLREEEPVEGIPCVVEEENRR